MAVGDRTEKKLHGPSAMSSTSGSPTSIAPNVGLEWITKQFVFTNTSGAEALVYLGVGNPSTAGNRVLSGLPIAANDVVVWDTALVITSSETLQFYADRAGVNITLMGWQKEI